MLLYRVPARREHTAVETIRVAFGLHALDDAEVLVVEVISVVNDMRAPHRNLLRSCHSLRNCHRVAAQFRLKYWFGVDCSPPDKKPFAATLHPTGTL